MANASDTASGKDATALADRQLFARFVWLTPRSVLYGSLAWIGLFALGSIGLANPFFTERAAGTGINYWNTMYLHGLLIGMASNRPRGE